MINKVTTKSKPLFCEEYWAKRSIKNFFKLKRSDQVSHRFDLHDVNYFLLGYTGSNSNPKTLLYADHPPITIHDVILATDKEFKNLKPTKEKTTVWRGIQEFEIFSDRFEKCYNVKKGEIIYMPEYAFADEEKLYAEGYARGNKAILYEINVPKGVKLSTKRHYIFPRYSKFECIDSEEKENYKLIKLDYLPKDESLFKYFAKKFFTCFNKKNEVNNADK